MQKWFSSSLCSFVCPPCFVVTFHNDKWLQNVCRESNDIWYGLDSPDSWQGPETCSCKYGNRLSESIKRRVISRLGEWLSKHSTSWCPACLILLNLATLIISYEQQKFLSSSLCNGFSFLYVEIYLNFYAYSLTQMMIR